MKKRKRGRPKTKDQIPYEKQVKELTLTYIQDELTKRIAIYLGSRSDLWEGNRDIRPQLKKPYPISSPPPDSLDMWRRCFLLDAGGHNITSPPAAYQLGYLAAVQDVRAAIRDLVEKKKIRINVEAYTLEAFDWMSRLERPDVLNKLISRLKEEEGPEWNEAEASRLISMLKEFATEQFERAPEDYRKKHRLPDKVDQFKKMIKGRRRIPEKEFAENLNLSGAELDKMLNEAEDRRVIRNWKRFQGNIEFDR